jgi:GT2 family glycosyltransferase
MNHQDSSARALSVSVVIPVCNGRQWLGDCLRSLAQQSGVTLEVLLVDDGSTDGSLPLAEEIWVALVTGWPLRTLKASEAGRPAGVSCARNLGWRSASHPLVAFLDADDLAFPQRLVLQAQALDADPALGHVMTGWRRFGAAGPEAGADVCPWLEGAGFELEPAFRLKAVLPSAWMLRRSALESAGGFQPGLAHAEDVDLMLRLALTGQRGSWVPQVLCGYRVHGGSASHHSAAQSRSLLWVMHQRLADVPSNHPVADRTQELVFATRAWSAWQAWQAGDGELALSLWRSSWGLSPLGPARTLLHLAEGVASHCRRIGVPFEPEVLLGDPHWQALECHVLAWLEHLAKSPAPLPPQRGTTLQHCWSLLAFGHHHRGLWSLRQQLAGQLHALEPLALGPGELRGWFVPTQPSRAEPAAALLDVRLEALDWIEQLLAWEGEPTAVETLLEDLHDLLCVWGQLCGAHSLTPAVTRLELAFALKPSARLLEELARLQAPSAPTASAALQQLAQRMPKEAEVSGSTQSSWPVIEPLPPRGRCKGPGCDACLPAGLDPVDGCAVSPEEDRPTLNCFPHGMAWLRPGPWSPWGSTTQVAVLDRNGVLQPSISRRYPQPWRGCRERSSWEGRADGGWTCPHSHAPRQLPGAVLAVADLSAEVHYHWLLDQLPRLGMALAWWQQHHGEQPLTIWLNGVCAGPGDQVPPRQAVLERLIEHLGLAAPQWIGANDAPFIQAERLLVPAFPHAFGEPGRLAIRWLRATFGVDGCTAEGAAGVAPGPALWMLRGEATRRRALGEEAALALLQARGVPIRGVNLAEHSLQEQAEAVATASLIVAPHGGALANLAFARPGTPVLELHGQSYAPPYFRSLAATLDLPLQRLAGQREIPELYTELVFGSALEAPIVLDPQAVADAVIRILQDCPTAPQAHACAP